MIFSYTYIFSYKAFSIFVGIMCIAVGLCTYTSGCSWFSFSLFKLNAQETSPSTIPDKSRSKVIWAFELPSYAVIVLLSLLHNCNFPNAYNLLVALSNLLIYLCSSYILRRPQNFPKSPPYFCLYVKFRFSKTATKFETISHIIWRVLSKCQMKWEIVSNFCGLFRKSKLYCRQK